MFTDPFCRTKLKLGEEDLALRHQVRTSDTDMNQHMNNTDYVRLILDTRPSSFWNTHRIRDFDVHYVSEAVEGEELQVYCQETSGQLAVQIKRGETSLVKAFLQLEPRSPQG